jgi:drug/metabolite transporter (DMT)-like permease
LSHTDVTLALSASLASAAAYGLASALQHEQAGQVRRRGALDPGLVASLATRPRWLVGIGADVLAVALQAVALRYGAVALVQPVLVAALPVSVLVAAGLARRRPGRREVLGLVLCTAGLLLLVPAGTTVGLGRSPSRVDVATSAAVLVAAVGLLLLLAHRRPRTAAPATGVAAGIVIGAASVLLAYCAARVGDLAALLTSLPPYAAVAAALLGLTLSQSAFQTGDLGAPLAALSVTEPVVAVGLAALVLHEHLPGGLLVRVAGALGAALAVVGVLALTVRAAADD